MDTTDGHQYYLKITNGAIGRSVGSIYGRPCLRVCEARESALLWALHFIDDVCGYRIRDIHYHEWIQMNAAAGQHPI